MNKKIITSLAAAALALCTVTSVSAVSNIPQTERPCMTWNCQQSAAMTTLEQQACDLINAQRRAHGLSPLSIRSDLSAKARIKSSDMKANRYFSHNSPIYGSPFQMMKQLGITYRSAGENIAMGYTTTDAVVRAWMASATHRANILSDRYTQMGIGYVDGYWTQWFIR